MNFLVVLAVLIALPFSAIASDYDQGNRPALIKGSKSYQVRYHKPTRAAVTQIEPASGVENSQDIIEKQKDSLLSKSQATGTDTKEKKQMRLHGKR